MAFLGPALPIRGAAGPERIGPAPDPPPPCAQRLCLQRRLRGPGAAAALAGYLRDLAWPHGGSIEIRQGEDMGTPCLITAELGPEPGGSVRVSGTVREMG